MENVTQPSTPNYQQPVNPPPVSLGDWIITFILMAIPLVNVIMLFVWGFGDTNPSKANWAKASLIFMLIGIIIYFFVFVILGIAFWGASNY
jgi:hypothetical protein